MQKLIFKSATFLFKNFFPLYKSLYYRYKLRKDSFEISLAKKFISKGEHVIDIGANIGFYAEIMSNLVGDGKVHCFEPDQINFKHLTENLHNRTNVILNNKAVAEEDGTLTLYTSDIINVDHTTYPRNHFDKTYTVVKTSIDNYVRNNFPVSFIKMDIQGAELKALEGMRQTLQSNKGIKLLTEIWPYGLKESNSSHGQILEFLEAMNFKLFLINKNSLVPISKNDVGSFKTEEKYYYNIIASRERLENV
jgi:FkbM family methyltransferase